ncbi:MAG: class I adenylate-forming enzyme family protein [Hyphomicrobiaceae bacterium]
MTVFGNHELAIPYRPVADLLGEYAKRDPAKVAIVDLDQGGASITFGELDSIVTDIAVDLKKRGVAKGDRVLLLSDETLEKLLIWLGAWRLGAVIAPLNIELNQNNLDELSRAVNPKIAFYHKDLDGPALTEGIKGGLIRFGAWKATDGKDPQDDYFPKLTRGGKAGDVPERNNAEDMSCMFCTSGTTSKPKIVVYDHCAYWLSGLDTLDILGLEADDKTLEYRSFGWNSAQILSLLPFLQKGLTMHIAKRFSHSRFFEWIQTYGITFAAGVPTVVNMLLNKPLGYTAKDIPTLRLMTCSTAPLTAEQWKNFEEMYGVTLLQLYGMSEAGWICGNRHYRRRMGTVGPPALHQEFEIVDGEGKKCSSEVEGEVTIGGPQIAIGYLMDDGSIDPVRGKRIKTGDLAKMDEDGFVRVTGRTKDLIIRGGMNIAPLEIDAVLLKHPNIFDGAAVGVPDKIYGEEVIAYAMPKPGTMLTEDDVIAHCKTHLAAAKIPKQVYIVSELPKSDRGKILRDKLREDWEKRQAS